MKYFVVFLLLLAFPAQAANSYKVNAGATVSVNEHGTCRNVKNNRSAAIFVPTKTATEWTNFRSNASGVTLSTCCAGNSVGGYCWYLSSTSQSCDQACSTRGGCNLAGTRDYAGTGGTLANCSAVLSALVGSSVSAVNNTNFSNGCMYFIFNSTPVYTRGTFTATTCDEAGGAEMRRACACNN